MRWRVASSDGHPIDGVIPFEVTAPAELATTEPAESATTEPAEPAIVTVPAEPTSEAASSVEESGLSTIAKVVIAIAAVGAVAALIVLVMKRLRTDRV